MQAFLKEFENRYGIQPDMVGASAYDAFMIIVDGIRRSGTLKGPAIRKTIASTKDYNGLTGVLKGFTDIGEVVKEVQVQIVRDGKFRKFGVVSDIKLITP